MISTCSLINDFIQRRKKGENLCAMQKITKWMKAMNKMLGKKLVPTEKTVKNIIPLRKRWPHKKMAKPMKKIKTKMTCN
jgi:hypothetical protein